MKFKKRPFTLLEVSIALVLVMMLSALLLRFFTESRLIKDRLGVAKEELLEREHCNFRLTKLFCTIPVASKFEPSNTQLATDQKTLHFLFDNGIDPSPDFSGPVMGTLLAKDHNLILQIRSLNPDVKEYREELLVRSVNKVDFSFFCLENKEYIWKESWENQELPLMMKITLHHEKEEIPFAFFFPDKEAISCEAS